MGDSLLDVAEMEAHLRRARVIAVLGIKPETRRHLDAHQIWPHELARHVTVGFRVCKPAASQRPGRLGMPF